MAKRKGTFTKAQMETLRKYESDFRTAVLGDYCMPVPEKEFKDVNAILEEVTGQKQYNQPFCSGCVLRLMKDVGRLYFKQVEEEKEREKE